MFILMFYTGCAPPAYFSSKLVQLFKGVVVSQNPRPSLRKGCVAGCGKSFHFLFLLAECLVGYP